MKRKMLSAISCLLVFGILFMSLPVTVFAAGQTTASDPAYYMTGSEIIDYVTKEDGFYGLSTQTAYNSAEDSVTVSYVAKPDSTDGKPGRAGISNISSLGIDAAEYPVVAIKVKLTNNTALKFGRLRWATTALASGFVTSNIADPINPAYRVTDNYQLMVFDLTKYNSEYLSGNYNAFKFDFACENEVITPTAVEWQSMAFFKTVADAEGWYAENDGLVGNDVEGRIVTLDDGNSSLVKPIDGANVAYDNDVNALRVYADGATKIEFNFASNGGAYEFDIAKYPIVAFHVKTNGTLVNGICSAATVDFRANGGSWQHYTNARFNYATTTDWQWVCYDVGAQNTPNMTGNWAGALLWFGAWGAADVYIDEIAFVSSTDEINDIFYKSVDKLEETVASAEAIDKSIYTVQTATALETAIANAKKVTANYALSVNSINAAAKNAEAAVVKAVAELEIATISDPAYYMTGSEIIDYVTKEDGFYGLSTQTAYNSAEDSVTVSYVAKPDNAQGKPGRAGISNISSLGIDATTYPVVAIKVKLTDNTNLQFGRFRWSTDAVMEAREAGIYGSRWVNYSEVASTNPVYRTTDNYQLMVFDLTKYNSEYLTDNYYAFMLDFAREDTVITPTAVEWQSIAFFKTVADAEGWYAENDGLVGNDVEGRIVTLDDGNSSLVKPIDGAKVEYDNNVNALRVYADGATKIEFNFASNGGAYEFDIAKYPIVAFHVKTNGALVNGICSAATVDFRANGVSWQHYTNPRFNYAATTDWQWVFYDVGAQNTPNMTGNWAGALLWFGAWGAADVYIDEIAFVSSADEINDIFYKSVDKLEDDITAAQNVDTTGFRSDTVAIINSAIADAQSISANKAVSVASVNKAVNDAKNKMETAINGLKYILKGDVNGNDAIDIVDLVMIKKYMAIPENVAVITDNSDFNNDGTIDTYELKQLRKYLLGIDGAI